MLSEPPQYHDWQGFMAFNKGGGLLRVLLENILQGAYIIIEIPNRTDATQEMGKGYLSYSTCIIFTYVLKFDVGDNNQLTQVVLLRLCNIQYR
jgi:hypothetical protein